MTPNLLRRYYFCLLYQAQPLNNLREVIIIRRLCLVLIICAIVRVFLP